MTEVINSIFRVTTSLGPSSRARLSHILPVGKMSTRENTVNHSKSSILWYNIGMKILAVESSCDETAAAVIEDGVKILSNVVVSQVDIFAAYGGVIPEVAARSHLEAILPVIQKALDDAGLTKDDIDCLAVTHTPGLLGSLLIGTLTMRMLAILWEKPLYAVHHLKSHIYAAWLTQQSAQPGFPLIALVISGGHTQIIYMPGHNEFEIIGTTRDDAVGECFDKVAKILGLPYPGGPAIAEAADGEAKYHLPKPKVEGLDFSFSGLKTAVLRAVQAELGLPITTPSFELQKHLSKKQVADFATSFQQAAVGILLDKLEMALEAHSEARTVVFAGGVSANKVLREEATRRLLGGLEGHSRWGDLQVCFPEPKFSGDNAAMVGAAAYFEIMAGAQPTDPYKLNIAPRTPIF